MATPQREAAAPPQAANAAVDGGAGFSRLIEAIEGASFNRVMKDGFRGVIEDLRRQHEAVKKLESLLAKQDVEVLKMVEEFESEKAQREAEFQEVTEELKSEKAQKEAQLRKVIKLESEKALKEAQVQKVMEENVRLYAMLDKKEAQLQAMSEQCKFMALNHHN